MYYFRVTVYKDNQKLISIMPWPGENYFQAKEDITNFLKSFRYEFNLELDHY